MTVAARQAELNQLFILTEDCARGGVLRQRLVRAVTCSGILADTSESRQLNWLQRAFAHSRVGSVILETVLLRVLTEGLGTDHKSAFAASTSAPLTITWLVVFVRVFAVKGSSFWALTHVS